MSTYIKKIIYTTHPAYVNVIAEVAIIVAWGIWVGHVYLEFSPDAIPSGREFLMGVQSHFSWRLLRECGSCFFWNGFVNGGAPAFVEIHGAWLHPLVAFPALLFDVIDGAKITIVLGLIMAGIAQWWLCRVLNISVIPRLWSCMMVVAAGHLSGKMDIGLVPLLLSVAACSLVIPPAIDLALNGKRRTAILLAFSLALAMVSGQGYLQIGLLLTIFPALLILLYDGNFHLKPQWKYFVLAGLLAILLASVFFIPLFHFGSNLGKGNDLVMGSRQPIQYLPLNLVISNPEFYYSTDLLKLPYPYLYVNYVGWIPVILSIYALAILFPKNRPLTFFFITAIVLIFLAASGITFNILGLVIPDIVLGIRNPTVIASLAVPLILALAALAVDAMFTSKNAWFVLAKIYDDNSKYKFKFNAYWIVILPMLFALLSAWNFSDNWMRMGNVNSKTREVISQFETSTAEWVQPPFGEHYWLLPAMDAKLKIAHYVLPWHWISREKPKPFMKGLRQQPLLEDGESLGTFDEIFITKLPQNEYALVQTPSGDIPCLAHARGGEIDVDCTVEHPGLLVVHENSWTGWTVKMDGVKIPLIHTNWLTTKIPSGIHHFEFRYRPWDVPLGIVLTIIGAIMAVWLWWKNPDQVLEYNKI